MRPRALGELRTGCTEGMNCVDWMGNIASLTDEPHPSSAPT